MVEYTTNEFDKTDSSDQMVVLYMYSVGGGGIISSRREMMGSGGEFILIYLFNIANLCWAFILYMYQICISHTIMRVYPFHGLLITIERQLPRLCPTAKYRATGFDVRLLGPNSWTR